MVERIPDLRASTSLDPLREKSRLHLAPERLFDLVAPHFQGRTDSLFHRVCRAAGVLRDPLSRGRSGALELRLALLGIQDRLRPVAALAAEEELLDVAELETRLARLEDAELGQVPVPLDPEHDLRVAGEEARAEQ